MKLSNWFLEILAITMNKKLITFIDFILLRNDGYKWTNNTNNSDTKSLFQNDLSKEDTKLYEVN